MSDHDEHFDDALANEPGVKVYTGASLEALKDSASKQAFGMTRSTALASGVCVSCRKAVKKANGEWNGQLFRTEAGKREWSISGLCESCFDSLFEDSEDQ